MVTHSTVDSYPFLPSAGKRETPEGCVSQQCMTFALLQIDSRKFVKGKIVLISEDL